MTLKAPFPYFGGKSTVAPVVWERLGDTPNYVEPFFGSGAMLLARLPKHIERNRIETVNDKDGMVSNLWRAVQHDAEAVAEYADWPVNENDLHARHAWLVGQRESLVSRLEGDPDYYDAKIAGYWVWGMSCWIGGGFCDGSGPWHVVDGQLVNTGKATGQAVYRKRPDLHHHGSGILAAGVQRKRPQPHNEMGINTDRVQSVGVSRQAPRLSGDQGVVRQMPEVVSDRGGHRDHSSGLYAYFDQLQARLRRVRVCSGDWSRIMGPSVTTGNGLTGVFLDPPYTHDSRYTGLYVEDAANILSDIRAWAIANGDNPLLRIAYCGYEDGFVWPDGWTTHRWTTNGGYGNQGNGRGKVNKLREVIWFSRHCLQPQLDLFTWAEQKEG